MDKCKLEVTKDYLYFYQDKGINISNNNKKCLRIYVNYKFIRSVFSITGFQTCNQLNKDGIL